MTSLTRRSGATTDLTWARVDAPVRVLDAGGWTDTWFAVQGLVCHVCVGPGARAVARKSPHRGPGAPELRLEVPDYHHMYRFPAGQPPGRHPLLEAALGRWAPPGHDVAVEVSSSVPGGSSLGTSAAVIVAIVMAVQALAGDPAGPAELAQAAHHVETVDGGRQSGVQDQAAAAFGGANLVRVAPYPNFEVERLAVPEPALKQLAGRMLTVYLGEHDSSEVHSSVIERLKASDRDGLRALDVLRAAAADAAGALVAGDLGLYAEAVSTATAAQSSLHPMLVGPAAHRVIEIAKQHKAWGWKVNGAGGPGGSVTVIAGEEVPALRAALAKEPRLRLLDLALWPAGAAVVDAG